mgnify:CR=1 FL=1
MTLWVIKIGTSLLRGNRYKTTAQIINSYAKCIASSKSRGDQVIIVTSGAVGLGCHRLGLSERPEDLVSLQATAAVGQVHLMALYENAMQHYGCTIAQILLTRADLESRKRYRNASETLKRLLDLDIIPIVNENDTLSPEELRYGDNDTLSALVATAVDADQLILLTDVDRLYSTDPRKDSNAKPILDVHDPKELVSLNKLDSGAGNWGTGGIKTKLDSAKIATASGITVHLADGRNAEILENLLKGTRGGTIFHPHPKPLKNKKSWLAHALKPLGSIQLDNGACEAIKNKGASVLLVGVQKVEGDFSANQPVRIIDNNSFEIGRGICSLSSDFLKNALNTPKSSLPSPLVIHRDVLVLTVNLFN